MPPRRSSRKRKDPLGLPADSEPTPEPLPPPEPATGVGVDPLDVLPTTGSPSERFLARADRVADRLADLVAEVAVHYGRLRAGGPEAEFVAHAEPCARRILDLDRRLPVPPADCLGEEAALLLALQAAANAVLQVAPDAVDPARRTPLHHPSFQASLAKCDRHLAAYRGARARPRPAGPAADATAP